MGMVPFSKDDLIKGRLMFRSGLAYQLPWWDATDKLTPRLAESSRGYVPMVRDGATGSAGFSGFVMTVNRDIFMLRHDFDSRRTKNNQFHSSYTGGALVAMAGTILIQKGRIYGVRTDSGHYWPGLHNMNSFLMALRMYGAQISKITLYDFKNTDLGKADVFLAKNTNWDLYSKGHDAEMDKRYGHFDGPADVKRMAERARANVAAPRVDANKIYNT
jgi:hypothetical protein